MKNKEKSFSVIDVREVESRMINVRGESVLLDRDVAELYGIETKRVNEAVRNNPEKFPADYMYELSKNESSVLRSKISSLEQTTGKGHYSKYAIKAFSEKGLYMLATILKSERATQATLAIIETYAQVRSLKRELMELHKEGDASKKGDLVKHFGETLAEIVMPDPDQIETESSLELNFLIGKLKHTVKKVKKNVK